MRFLPKFFASLSLIFFVATFPVLVFATPAITPPPVAIPDTPTTTNTDSTARPPASKNPPSDVEESSKVATKSVGATITSPTETKGFLQNPWIPAVLAGLFVLLGGSLGVFLKKKREQEPTTENKPKEEVK